MKVRRRAPLRSTALSALVAGLLQVVPTLAPAQAGLPAATGSRAASAPVFAIEGFRIEGPNPLGESQSQAVLAPFVRPDADLQVLHAAVSALEQALRARGHDLHRIVLPPQDLGGAVVLEIVAVTLGRVRVEGLTLRSEERIRAALPELQEGRAPSLQRLAVQAGIANLDPNRRIDVSLSEGERPGELDAVVRVLEQRPLVLSVTLSNTGNAATARDRATLALSHTDLFGRDHQLAAAYTTSLERPRDVRQFGMSYSVLLYAEGAVASFSYTRSDVVGQFGSFTSTGAGHALQLAYTQHLLPRDDVRSELTFAIEDRLYEGADINGVPVGRDRRARPLRLRYAAGRRTLARSWNGSLEVAVNTAWGAANSLAAYQAEYPGIRRVHWRAIRGDLDYGEPAGSGWSWLARAAWQYSPHALIAGEQFGLGGPYSVRGTRHERALAGDMGVAATVELATQALADGVRAFGFVDAGWIGNHATAGMQRPARDRLASAGLGVRYSSASIGASAEYGRVLVGSRSAATLSPSAPQEGEGRLYLQATYRY